MKSYIVGAGMLLILLFFIFQWVSNENAYYKRTMLVNIVESHAQQARMEGYFTPEIKEALTKEIVEKTKTPASEVIVNVTETKVCTRETFDQSQQISYEVKVPIRNIVAMANFLNIDESDNMYWFPLVGKVSSEKLCDT